MEVIFLIGLIQAFFLASLAFGKKDKGVEDIVLAIWLLFSGSHLLYYYLYTSDILYEYPHFLGIGSGFPMLHGPILFIYTLITISKDKKFKPVYLLHGIPFIIFTAFYVFDFYILSGAEKIQYYQELNKDPHLLIIIMSSPNILGTPVYVIWSLMVLRRYAKMIPDEFSYTERINLKWLRYLYLSFAFISLVVILVNIPGIIPNSLNLIKDDYIYIAVTLAIFYIGFFGIKQQKIFGRAETIADIPDERDDLGPRGKKQYLHSGLKKEQAEVYKKELLQLFETEKPYLNGKLNLKELAEMMNISSNHLSQVINEHLNKSFFDFVNEYRINEFKMKLRDPKNKHFTILAIAFDCGFSSKSGFNNIFKKYNGISPSQFIKQNIAS
jgi:AraC-like DNA-binding protein